jgi:hypothetical protein
MAATEAIIEGQGDNSTGPPTRCGMTAVSLKQAQALTELADRLYAFLPGKPHPYADQNLSFPGVAAQLGLHGYWPGGSKLPAITALLRTTLERESGRFCPLILAIVQNGMAYRMKPASRWIERYIFWRRAGAMSRPQTPTF